jgi:hypothetical protein
MTSGEKSMEIMWGSQLYSGVSSKWLTVHIRSLDRGGPINANHNCDKECTDPQNETNKGMHQRIPHMELNERGMKLNKLVQTFQATLYMFILSEIPFQSQKYLSHIKVKNKMCFFNVSWLSEHAMLALQQNPGSRNPTCHRFKSTEGLLKTCQHLSHTLLSVHISRCNQSH